LKLAGKRRVLLLRVELAHIVVRRRILARDGGLVPGVPLAGIGVELALREPELALHPLVRQSGLHRRIRAVTGGCIGISGIRHVALLLLAEAELRGRVLAPRIVQSGAVRGVGILALRCVVRRRAELRGRVGRRLVGEARLLPEPGLRQRARRVLPRIELADPGLILRVEQARLLAVRRVRLGKAGGGVEALIQQAGVQRGPGPVLVPEQLALRDSEPRAAECAVAGALRLKPGLIPRRLLIEVGKRGVADLIVIRILIGREIVEQAARRRVGSGGAGRLRDLGSVD
jgi:hypothetical protein